MRAATRIHGGSERGEGMCLPYLNHNVEVLRLPTVVALVALEPRAHRGRHLARSERLRIRSGGNLRNNPTKDRSWR